MLNKAILMGRLTRDPELRHTQSNIPVTSFTLAIDRNRKSSDGNRETDFIDCVAWNRQAEFVTQWFAKGTMAIVTGRIQSRNWEDKNGNKRVSVEVVADEINFGETKKAREANGGSFSGGFSGGSQESRYDSGSQEQPAPAPSFDLPTGDETGFSELSDDDDSDVPF